MEVAQIIKPDLTTKSKDIMTLNDWAIKWEVKFCTDKCKVLKTGGKSKTVYTVYQADISQERAQKNVPPEMQLIPHRAQKCNHTIVNIKCTNVLSFA